MFCQKTDLSQRHIWEVVQSGKVFNHLCAALGAFFSPSTLILVWTFQPLFEIGRFSSPIAILRLCTEFTEE